MRDQLILFSDNVSFQTIPQHFISDGSATFNFRRLHNISLLWDSYGNGCNLYGYIIYYNGLFLEQLGTQNTIFQLAYNNTIYYTLKPDGLLVSRF